MLLPRLLLAPHPRRRHTRQLNHLDRQIRPTPSTQAEADATDGEITAKGITVADLARTLTLELSHELGRTVSDETNLPGRFDLTLKWP